MLHRLCVPLITQNYLLFFSIHQHWGPVFVSYLESSKCQVTWSVDGKRSWSELKAKFQVTLTSRYDTEDGSRWFLQGSQIIPMIGLGYGMLQEASTNNRFNVDSHFGNNPISDSGRLGDFRSSNFISEPHTRHCEKQSDMAVLNKNPLYCWVLILIQFKLLYIRRKAFTQFLSTHVIHLPNLAIRSFGYPITNVNDHRGYCPASRTTLVATRFRVAVICPIIQVPHCIRVFFYFVWFVFINHIFQFYYELCTYCNILDIYLS